MTVSLGILLFVTDAITAYMGGKYLDARQQRRRVVTILWDGALAVVVGLNLLAYVTLGWPAIPVSVAGSMLGTGLSFLDDDDE